MFDEYEIIQLVKYCLPLLQIIERSLSAVDKKLRNLLIDQV